jgi:hypothetical protein
MSVGNAMAYAQNVPIVACGGDDWLKESVERLQAGQNDKVGIPEYGAPPHVTKPRK